MSAPVDESLVGVVFTPLPRLLSVPEVARYLGRSPAAIHAARTRGTLPPGVLVAGRRYWREDEIAALVRAR